MSVSSPSINIEIITEVKGHLAVAEVSNDCASCLCKIVLKSPFLNVREKETCYQKRTFLQQSCYSDLKYPAFTSISNTFSFCELKGGQLKMFLN